MTRRIKVAATALIAVVLLSNPPAANAQEATNRECGATSFTGSFKNDAVNIEGSCGKKSDLRTAHDGLTNEAQSRPQAPSTKRTTLVSGCIENLAGEPGLETCAEQEEAFCPGDSAWVMPETTDTAAPGDRPDYGRRQCTGTAPDAGQAPEPEISVSLEDVEELMPLQPKIATDNGGRGVRNAETNFYTPTHQNSTTTTINGQQVEIRATIVSYTWDYGDGSAPRVTATGGESQTEFNVPTDTSHVYRETGQYTVTLRAAYVGEYRVEGGEWRTIEGSLTREAQPVTADIWRTVTRNVADDCGANPSAWGCTGPISAENGG